MLNLLNTMAIFGAMAATNNLYNQYSGVFWLLLALGILLLAEIVVFAILMIYRHRRSDRMLTGITLDTSVVKREYAVGEKLDTNGLVVTAHYTKEPIALTVYDYEIAAPDMDVEGKLVVTILYEGMSAVYAIYVGEQATSDKVAVAAGSERKLVGITLDTDGVCREYNAGDKLDTKGLVVYGQYNTEPYEVEIRSGYSIRPVDMQHVGMPTVMVTYGEFSCGYQIFVDPIIVEEGPTVIRIKRDPVVIAEEQSESNTLHYDRSFTARFIQSDEETKHWYTELKNYLLSFKKVKDRMSWKRESYRYGREPVVRMAFRGKTLCLYFPLNANDYVDSKYKVEEVVDNATYADTPCMYRIKNARRAKYAKELIDAVLARFGDVKRIERDSVDYYMPYEGVVELIDKGLIKRKVSSSDSVAPFMQKAAAATTANSEPQEVAPGLFVATKK